MNKLIAFFVPKETEFFVLLENQSQTVLESGRVFSELISNYNKWPDAKRHHALLQIKKLESKGDDQSGEILELLNKTLITPYDREDIHALTVALDDLIDLIDETSRKLMLYKIQKVPLLLVQHADLLYDMLKTAHLAIKHLPKLEQAKKYCSELYHWEHQGDRLFEKSISELFDGKNAKSQNVIDIIKFKDLTEDLENAFDKGKDLADTIQQIVVKHG